MKTLAILLALTATTVWADTIDSCLHTEPREVSILESFAHLVAMPFRAVGCVAQDALAGDREFTADVDQQLPQSRTLIVNGTQYDIRTWQGTTTVDAR